MRLTERSHDLSEAPDRAAATERARHARRAQELEAELAESRREIDALRATLSQVESSTIWQAVGALRRRVYARIGEDSRTARALRGAVRATVGLASPRPPAPRVIAAQPIAELPEFDAPEVSLILPVHSQPELTAACVRAIVAGATVPYELIIVDDTATAAMKEVVTRIAGARVVVNETNLGYTRSLNRGAAVARAPFLMFLNDDTVPEPGWLEAMADCARSSDDIGVVVPMYLDTDGRLKEAGSIVWSDGSAENFGRGDECTMRARYRYRRDVDYGSGACLLVRSSVFREIGGLDEQFSPAWFEDVDFCRRLDQAKKELFVVPAARARHAGGASLEHMPYARFIDLWYRNMWRYAHKWFSPGKAEALRWAVVVGMVLRCFAALAGFRNGSSNRWEALRIYARVMKRALNRWDDSSPSPS